MTESRTILVADDEAIVRDTLRALLEDAGYEVEEAANGQEAVHATRTVRPDLVILDINMPDLDGYSVLLLMKSQPLQRDLPVIVLTGEFVGEEYERHSQALGALYHVGKPIGRDRLLSVVKEALS